MCLRTEPRSPLAPTFLPPPPLPPPQLLLHSRSLLPTCLLHLPLLGSTLWLASESLSLVCCLPMVRARLQSSSSLSSSSSFRWYHPMTSMTTRMTMKRKRKKRSAADVRVAPAWWSKMTAVALTKPGAVPKKDAVPKNGAVLKNDAAPKNDAVYSQILLPRLVRNLRPHWNIKENEKKQTLHHQGKKSYDRAQTCRVRECAALYFARP